MKKIFSLLFILAIFLIPSILVFDNNFIYAEKVVSQTEEVNNSNIQTYIADDNQKHTIYWAKGINPPKMLGKNEEIEPNTRYFEKNEININKEKYISYIYPMEEGKGYFDFNKNPDRTSDFPNQVSHHCYIASALNQIHWWLEQNRSNIDKYIEQIKNNKFAQISELHSTDDFNMWERFLATPKVDYLEKYNCYSQELSNDPIYLELFNVYQNRNVGGHPDIVWDNFINGYHFTSPKEEPNGFAPPNTTDIWKPSSNAGLFFPIFQKQQLSKRYPAGNYDLFSKRVKELLLTNHGLCLAYKSVGFAHAITIWGAEYDDNDNLIQLYLTDSDDYVTGKENIIKQGLYTNFVYNNQGKLILTSRVNPNSNGSEILSIYALSLGEDIWKEKLNNKQIAPYKPKIISQPEDRSYALNTDISNEPLTINAESVDNGFISYQWYKCDSLNSESIKLMNQTKSTYVPVTNVLGDKYYYCEIINNLNGKQEIVKSRYIKITIKNEEIVNAETPNIKSIAGSKKYYRYTIPKPIIMRASVSSGTLTYQWYRANDSTAKNGVPIIGETRDRYYPPTNDIGRSFYYCEVTNTDFTVSGRKTSKAYSNLSENIIIIDASIENAGSPLIIEQSKDITCNLGDKIGPLKLTVKIFDGGKLTYQWYKTNNIDSVGELLINENSNIYLPKTNKSGTVYYYCKITNTNDKASNNKISTIESNKIKVTINGEGQECEHNFVMKKDASYHWEECSKCGEIRNKTLHSYSDWTIEKEASCESNGRKYKTCLVCGEKVYEDIPKLGHNFGAWEVVKKATCSETGLEKRYCQNKGCLHFEERVIPKLEHNFVDKHDKTNHWKECETCHEKKDIQPHSFGEWEVIRDATCKNTGIKRKTCKCGYFEEKTIELKPHSYSDWIIEKEASCESNGRKYKTCLVCGEKVYEDIPKLGHNFGAWEVVKKATCSETGLEKRYCQNKGCLHFEERVIPKLEHNFGEWKIEKVATCISEGRKTRECKICHIKEVQILPKLEHNFVDKHDKTNHWKECETCHEKKDIKPHSFGEWEVIKQPTKNETGLKQRHCSICDYTETEVIPALGDGEIKPIEPPKPDKPNEDKKPAIKELTKKQKTQVIIITGVFVILFAVIYIINIFKKW